MQNQNNFFAAVSDQTNPHHALDVIDEQERMARIQLYRSKNIGPITYRALLNRYRTAQEALAFLTSSTGQKSMKHGFQLYSQDALLREIDRHHKDKASLIVEGDPEYPHALTSVVDAPPVLSIKGHASLLQRKCVGIVGARNCSLNGKKLAYNWAQILGKDHYVVASGLARGIDTQAHIGALTTGTLAVIAGGIDQVYPPENAKLLAQITEQGVLVAESEFGTEPQSTFFPRRNRLISGLSQGVLIIEAALQSGSLTTARYACEQNREVFVIPGSPLDPRYAGSNILLKSGAHLVTSAQDILDILAEPYHQALVKAAPATKTLAFDFEAPTPDPTPSPDQDNHRAQDQDLRAELLNLLSSTPISLDELLRACSFPSGKAMAMLMELELAGKAIRHAGNMIST